MALGQDGAAGLGWDGHLFSLHASETERRSQLATWVRWGLERDEQVIYGQDDPESSDPDFSGPESPDPESPELSVLAVLARQGIDVQAATAQGRLLVLPLAAVYGAGPDEQVARVERALAEGYRGVRTSGQASAGRTGAPEEVYPGLARRVERLCRTHPVSALCQYDRAMTVGAGLEQAAAAHGGGIREAQLHTARTSDATGSQLSLAGEVDWSNELVLLSAVEAAVSTASEMFWLDLRRVAFLSVGGCRALVAGTQPFRDQGGQLLLVAPQPIAERVLRLSGLDALLNVEIVGSGL
jgi:anti-anti-sigma factor